MILIDKLGHLVATESEAELHTFATRVGLKRIWYQNNSKHPHYDITTKRMHNKVVANGARLVSSKNLVLQAWWRK